MHGATLSLARELVRDSLCPITGAAADYDPLLDVVGDARFVLLGEATHGTHEFYRSRAGITRRLIEEKGFNAVAVEADWPDANRVNSYIQARSTDADAEQALRGFERFPAWMWRNADFLDFVGWLRAYNDALPPESPARVSFYGLDLYSLPASIAAVLSYLERVDPEAAARARYRYACFDHFGEDPQAYGYAAGFGLSEGCESEVVAQLVDLEQNARQYAGRDGSIAVDDFFSAEQNARLVRNAEQYYRTMFRGRVASWNLRDSHMAETVDSLVRYLQGRKQRPKLVLWAHNSHLGDARATQMHAAGEWNVGQLIREKYAEESCLVGFTTWSGTVTAASDWGGPAERKRVRPARPDSYEGLFHSVEVPAFLLPLAPHTPVAGSLTGPMLERAIGVIYLPQSELSSHYFEARLSEQFDAVVHVDETRAVEPLEAAVVGSDGEPAETFPSGI